MKKKLIVIMGVMIMFSLFGCDKKYNVSYAGGKEGYIGAKDSYRPGSTVRFKIIYGTDTDYSLYVDDKYVSVDKVDNQYMYYKFIMPDHDIIVCLNSRNSMAFEDEEYENKEMLVQYTHQIVGTAIERGSYTITLNTYSKQFNQIVICDSDNPELTVNRKSWLVSRQSEYDVLDLIDELGFDNWNSLKKYSVIDGASYTLVYLKDGKYISVGSGKMPEDGIRKLQEVQLFLEQCAGNGREQ